MLDLPFHASSVFGGIGLCALLARQNLVEIAVSLRGFQTRIYYPTWTRLDPLVFGVVLAAIEKFRTQWWRRLINLAYGFFCPDSP